MLGGVEPKIIVFGGNKVSRDTKVSLENGEKSSVTSLEDYTWERKDYISKERKKVTKVMGPHGGSSAKAKLRS